MTPTQISSYFCPTEVIIGVNAHERLSAVIREHGWTRMFIALDAALQKSEFYSRIAAILHDCNVAACTFTQIEPDPSADTVARAFAACSEHRAQAILAIGGGSTIDVAKAVGILATNGGRIHDYEGIEKFSTPPLPRIAVPTTAGTGSEVSGSCVITDTEKNLKMSIRHARLNPADVAILDPLALVTCPAHVAAHAGIDAFVHAFESYVSVNASPITDAQNLHAIELISGNIRQFVSNRGNLTAGLAMLCGSSMAGMAFGITGLGNVHCMARFVGAGYHLSHGFSNALCLPAVARFNMIANPAKFARVASAMGCFVDGMPELEAARKAVQAIEALCLDLGICERLSDFGATQDHLAEMARLCVEANYNRWNPRHTTQKDFLNLFQEIL